MRTMTASMLWRGSALAAAALVAGCAVSPVAWTKIDADPAAPRTQLDECRKLALDEMWRMSWERMWPPRFYDPKFMPPLYAAAQPFWLGAPKSVELEQALVDFCMYSNGYRRAGSLDRGTAD